ncbi:MAG: hypothetical protein ACRD8O_13330, partial [Bryobacteraceae bacterium]
ILGVSKGTLTAAASATVDVVYGNTASGSTLNLDGADGFRYNVSLGGCIAGNIGAAGTVDGRLNNAYFSNGFSPGFCPEPSAVLDSGGRQVTLGPDLNGALKVHRKVFVPTRGGFARHLEILTNPTAVPWTKPVKLSGTMGSLTQTRLVIAPEATNNTYTLTDKNGVCCVPVLAHVFGGPGAALVTNGVRFVNGQGDFYYQWSVTVQPGQTVILMHFAIQRDIGDLDGARAQAEALVNLSDPDALVGMTATEKAQVVNFRIQ